VLPDVPQIDEAGVPGFAVDNWYAIFYPAGTPDAIVQHGHFVEGPRGSLHSKRQAGGCEAVAD